MMDSDQFVAASGPVDARYLAFLETISTLRPSLHRYCARMTGSVMDGEDVVQEALVEAYRKLDQFDESRPLKPWLFRIAHNRSIDFLRRNVPVFFLRTYVIIRLRKLRSWSIPPWEASRRRSTAVG